MNIKSKIIMKKKPLYPKSPKSLVTVMLKKIKIGEYDLEGYVSDHILHDKYKSALLIEFLDEIETHYYSSENLADDDHYYLGMTVTNKGSKECIPVIFELEKHNLQWKVYNILLTVELEKSTDVKVLMHEGEVYHIKELRGLFEDFDECI